MLNSLPDLLARPILTHAVHDGPAALVAASVKLVHMTILSQDQGRHQADLHGLHVRIAAASTHLPQQLLPLILHSLEAFLANLGMPVLSPL